jgi:hypothetical protein
LRAKRAQEAAERRFRQQEKEKAEKAARLQAEIQKSREDQRADKERRMLEVRE